MRLFVAVDLPREVVEEIERIQLYFKQRGLFHGTYVKPLQAHVTLKFLGDVSEQAVTLLKEALQKISCAPVAAQTAGISFFQDESYIKVLYLDLICPELEALAAQIEAVVQPWVAPEERSFAAHVTFARLKSVTNKEKLVQKVGQFQVKKLHWTIGGFALKKSVLRSEGPEYETIAYFPFYQQ